jgi:Putative addiction module component
MTLDVLKSEALKLGRIEMLEFVQFIVQTLKEREVESTLSQAQKSEVKLRLKEVQENPSVCVSGLETEEELIARYGLEV